MILNKIFRSVSDDPPQNLPISFSAGFLALGVVEGLVLILLILTSCSTSRHVQTVPVETLCHDTLYINKQSYDSIYINNSHLIDRGGDTITITKTKTEYRFRFLRDTIRIAKCDSIPYEVRVKEVKEVPRPRNLFDYISYVCFGIILGLVVNKARAIVRTST